LLTKDLKYISEEEYDKVAKEQAVVGMLDQINKQVQKEKTKKIIGKAKALTVSLVVATP
jgi:hypothetical protein